MTIDELRARIDVLDETLVRALNERAALAIEVGAEKKKLGKALYDPAREAQILDKIAAKNRGPLSPEAVRALFLEVIAACRKAEKLANDLGAEEFDR